ncbi:DUF3579 domain-containing protein [Sideroxydans lithotrophicus]|uniref:DUF3579 domain-containing protein n=1 Tax=Sideroxydans lithotrophicus (strain ES-1) TaxID=580332 RepID=D5CQM8_SIDLE|nr:DUF3579 domain-containing protein [Sideroxydans lithotrophicus]ADE11264.1 hypothetical protein Slit_1026 [Sideroxydans lithotrophicus ES-1]
MLPGVAEFVVQGITVDGEVLQPPEWAEQLCSSLGKADPDGRVYASHARPMVVNGVQSVVVRLSLKLVDENAFETIKQFVTEHRLQVRAGRGSRDAEGAESHLVVEQERRSPKNNDW